MTKETSEEPLLPILPTESALAGWFSGTMLLLTNALVFFHLAKVRTLEMQPAVAGVVATSMILLSVFMLIWSMCVYAWRLRHIIRDDKTVAKHENRLIPLSTIGLFLLICLLFLFIAAHILRQAGISADSDS